MTQELSARERPKEVVYALWALVFWTLWTCLFGVYQTWSQIPELQAVISGQFQGLVSFDTQMVLQTAIISYTSFAVIVFWCIYKIAQGKNWARSSLMWGLVLQFLWDMVPPYSLAGFLADIPDIGLQLYAVYLLYTWPGRTWFISKEALSNSHIKDL